MANEPTRTGHETAVERAGPATAQAAVPLPHANFETPDQVVIDPALSKAEKVEALGALEQDARQMADATGEGMNGGEPTALSEVLHAQQALELPPTAFAYALVLKDLEARLLAGDRDEAAIGRAIAALTEVGVAA